MSPWQKVARKGGEAPEPTPLVTLRRAGVAFNAAFVRSASLANKTHVAVQVDSASFRVGFRFLDAPTDTDCWALTHDGGGRGEGRWAQAGSLLQLPWIASVARIQDHQRRRFKPKWSSADSMWVVTLCPAFENRVSAVSEVPSDARGIYRYLRGEEVMYIGRGVIRSRFNAPERREWDIETIEYSLIPDEAQQTHWESYWLDAFVQEYGKLPIYNRIGGVSRSVASEG
jgi:hypothetical protein